MTNELLQQIVGVIVDEVDPEQIILFEVHAHGATSMRIQTIDLVSFGADPFGGGRTRHREEVQLYRALSGFHVSKDIELVYTREDPEYWGSSLNHVSGGGRYRVGPL